MADSTGKVVPVVTVLLRDSSGAPWKQFVIAERAARGKTQVGMTAGARFKAYCDYYLGAPFDATLLIVQFVNEKGHKKTEMHSVVPGRSDACY